MTMQALSGATRWAMLGFFVSHIVFTVLVDGQIVWAKSYPTALRDFSAWFVETFNDPLCAAPSPLWFQSLVVLECCFQLPFFFVACFYFSKATLASYPTWFRYACITYGGHAATSMAPILTSLATNVNASTEERYRILAVYLPYLIFPVWLWTIAVSSTDGTTTTTSANRAAATAPAGNLRAKVH
jgi:EXPERA (EXPanded EBP superfamily)